jgi:hypothetical protein
VQWVQLPVARVANLKTGSGKGLATAALAKVLSVSTPWAEDKAAMLA